MVPGQERNHMKKKASIVDANDKPFISKENLPLPFVHYPGIVGPFIGFSEEETSVLTHLYSV